MVSNLSKMKNWNVLLFFVLIQLFLFNQIIMAEDPVWKPYFMQDITGPFSLRIAKSGQWKALRALQGIGAKFVLSKKTDIDFALQIRPKDQGYIWLDTRYFYDSGKYRPISNLRTQNINLQTIENYKGVFWISPLDWNSGHAFQYLGYNTFQNNLTNAYVGTHYVTGGCDPGAVSYWEWYPDKNSKNVRTFSVYTNQGDDIWAFWDGGHTPFEYYGRMCADGRSVHDSNRFKIRRLRLGDTKVLSAYRYYRLDTPGRYCDYRNRDCGTAFNVIGRRQNIRDDGANKAPKFATGERGSQARIVFPISVFDHIAQNNDFTIAFWMYLPDSVKQTRERQYPSQSDTWLSAFYATDLEGQPLLGISTNKNGAKDGKSTGHIALTRFTSLLSAQYSWLQWLADPIVPDFESQGTSEPNGWTYVVLYQSHLKISCGVDRS